MDFGGNIIIWLSLAITLGAYSSPAFTLPTGIHPQDEKYYYYGGGGSLSDVIKCRDGSKSFTRDRLNDGFCDCVDGTDEPGTSACPDGRFYCRNEGSIPQILFSSRVNDHLCDCCDGSDEYDGSINCLNTCVGEASVSNNGNNNRKIVIWRDVNAQKKNIVSMEDLVQKLKELKIVIFLEVAFIVMAFRLLNRHIRSRR